MNSNLYDMIFKRKSFHLFRDIGEEKITENELKDIEDYFYTIQPLCDDIKVKMKITKDTSSCDRGQEYCLYLYSETKPNYLQNIGYIGQQLDLYMVSKNIGTLWYGIGKPKDNILDGLTYVIMFAIAKVDSPSKFRKDMFKSKRKEVEEIWKGEHILDIPNIVRFAPSACNSQPWIIENKDKCLSIYRHRNLERRGIMPVNMVNYFNQIDIGILLCFLEKCLVKNNIYFKRELFIEEDSDLEFNLTAKYYMEDK